MQNIADGADLNDLYFMTPAMDVDTDNQQGASEGEDDEPVDRAERRNRNRNTRELDISMEEDNSENEDDDVPEQRRTAGGGGGLAPDEDHEDGDEDEEMQDDEEDDDEEEEEEEEDDEEDEDDFLEPAVRLSELWSSFFRSLDQLIVCLVERSIVWLIDYFDSECAGSIDWLIDWFIMCWFDWLIDWFGLHGLGLHFFFLYH